MKTNSILIKTLTITRNSEIEEEKGQKTPQDIGVHYDFTVGTPCCQGNTKNDKRNLKKVKELCYSKVSSSWSRDSLKTGRKPASSRPDRGLILKNKQ